MKQLGKQLRASVKLKATAWLPTLQTSLQLQCPSRVAGNNSVLQVIHPHSRR